MTIGVKKRKVRKIAESFKYCVDHTTYGTRLRKYWKKCLYIRYNGVSENEICVYEGGKIVPVSFSSDEDLCINLINFLTDNWINYQYIE